MSSDLLLTDAARGSAALLKASGQRVATIEATTGGLIGAGLLSCDGASRFFVSSCVVYSGRGYKMHLPADVLIASGVSERDTNYSGKKRYVESKMRFVREVARRMQLLYRADWMVVESGTAGPEFYIPGVTSGFTAIGIVGPPHPRTGERFEVVELVETGSSSRTDNMTAYARRALALLEESIRAFQTSLIDGPQSKL